MISISLGEGGGGHVLWCVVGLSGFCSAMNYETNIWQRLSNSLIYLLIAMATCPSLTTRNLASGSSVLTVTSYTPLSEMGM